MTTFKMPEPKYTTSKSGRLFTYPDEVDCTGNEINVYTADQLKKALRDVLEQAAKGLLTVHANSNTDEKTIVACVDRIRAMKEKIK